MGELYLNVRNFVYLCVHLVAIDRNGMIYVCACCGYSCSGRGKGDLFS